MTYIYSYRLTHFGGTAPCFDNNLLTLAICKRDMRRVIGNLYNSKKFDKEKDEIWFLGIVGNALANEKGFENYKDKIIYAAKVTEVVEFHNYYIKGNNRSDNIYEQTSNESVLISNKICFKHKKGIDIHSEPELQSRDFDVDHPKSKKYVLKSNKYCFVSNLDSETIKGIIDKYQKWPTGVGHRRVEDDKNELAEILNSLIAKGHNNIKALPEEVKEIINNKKAVIKETEETSDESYLIPQRF